MPRTLRIIGVSKTNTLLIEGREDNQSLVGKPGNQKIKMFIKCQILINATKIKQEKLIVCTVVKRDVGRGCYAPKL